MSNFESVVEQAAIEWFQDLGYDYLHGVVIAPDGTNPERKGWSDTMLVGRLRAALNRINPSLPGDVLDDVVRHLIAHQRG